MIAAATRFLPAALHDPAIARLLPGRASSGLALLAGILVLLAVLALGFAVAAHRAAERWAGEVTAAATLSVIADEAELEAQARIALDILAETPGVLQIRVMEPAEQRALLAPWLGTGIAIDGVDLPLMIEVESDRRILDTAALDARLAAEAPGAVFDDHAAWRLPLAAAAERQRRHALAAAALMVGAVALLAMLAARSSMGEAGRAVAILKSIGVSDGPLGSVVAARVAASIAVGACAGTLLGVLFVGGTGDQPPTATIEAGFSGWTWALPLLLLLGVAALTWLAATAAARRALKRWP